MAISEAARSDLYTVLRKVIGPDPAETLMTVFPRYETDQVATKGDLAVLRAEFKTDIAELRAEIAALIASVHKTMAIWSLTILVTVIGAMVGLLSLN